MIANADTAESLLFNLVRATFLTDVSEPSRHNLEL